jgi:hypothetical protein
MMPSVPPRLRKPVGTMIFGLLFAAAWLVRGGPLWWVSIMAVVATAGRALSSYRLGGRDTDEGALAGSRADERQKQLSLRSRALAFDLVVITAFVGLTAAIAVKGGWWWPCLIVLAVAGFGYLLGLSQYGVSEDDPAADGAAAGLRVRPPVRG